MIRPHKTVKRLASLVMGAAMALGITAGSGIAAYAQEAQNAKNTFDGGAGTESRPYLISTPEQLDAVRDYNSKYFKLTNDIDVFDWEPIESFIGGGLDGDGYTLSYLQTEGGRYGGLFGSTRRVSVLNLGIENASIQGEDAAGGVMGKAVGGSIKNCYVTGKVNSSGPSGGLVGDADKTVVSGCYAMVTSDSSKAGGIAGTGGKLSGCYYSSDMLDSAVGDTKDTAGAMSTSQMKTLTFASILDANRLDSLKEWTAGDDGKPVMKTPPPTATPVAEDSVYGGDFSTQTGTRTGNGSSTDLLSTPREGVPSTSPNDYPYIKTALDGVNDQIKNDDTYYNAEDAIKDIAINAPQNGKLTYKNLKDGHHSAGEIVKDGDVQLIDNLGTITEGMAADNAYRLVTAKKATVFNWAKIEEEYQKAKDKYDADKEDYDTALEQAKQDYKDAHDAWVALGTDPNRGDEPKLEDYTSGLTEPNPEDYFKDIIRDLRETTTPSQYYKQDYVIVDETKDQGSIINPIEYTGGTIGTKTATFKGSVDFNKRTIKSTGTLTKYANHVVREPVNDGDSPQYGDQSYLFVADDTAQFTSLTPDSSGNTTVSYENRALYPWVLAKITKIELNEIEPLGGGVGRLFDVSAAQENYYVINNETGKLQGWQYKNAQSAWVEAFTDKDSMVASQDTEYKTTVNLRPKQVLFSDFFFSSTPSDYSYGKEDSSTIRIRYPSDSPVLESKYFNKDTENIASVIVGPDSITETFSPLTISFNRTQYISIDPTYSKSEMDMEAMAGMNSTRNYNVAYKPGVVDPVASMETFRFRKENDITGNAFSGVTVYAFNHYEDGTPLMNLSISADATQLQGTFRLNLYYNGSGTPQKLYETGTKIPAVFTLVVKPASALSGEVQIVSSNPSSVNLKWNPVEQNSGAWKYTVYYSDSEKDLINTDYSNLVNNNNIRSYYADLNTTAEIKDLNSEKTYYFNVQATNSGTNTKVLYKGASTDTGKEGQLNAPTITTDPADTSNMRNGTPVYVTMKAESGATIYYTLDGKAPTSSSTKYTGEVKITNSKNTGETIKISAIAIDSSNSGRPDSTVSTAEIVYKTSSLLPLDNKVIDIYDTTWAELNDALEATQTGTVRIMLDSRTTTISKSTLAAIKGKKMTVIFDMGDYFWTVNGEDVKTARESVDLGLYYANNFNTLPATYLSSFKDYIDIYQMELDHDGPLPFDAKLTLYLGRGNSGKFGNLYYANESKKKSMFMESTAIKKDGSCEFTFSHASKYAIVITDTAMTNVSTGAAVYDGDMMMRNLPIVPICAGALGFGVLCFIVIQLVVRRD